MNYIQPFISHLKEAEGLSTACSCCLVLLMWYQQTLLPITTATLLVLSMRTLGKNLHEAYPFLQVKIGTHDTKTSFSYGSVADHLFQAANPAIILSSTGNKKGHELGLP